MVDDYINVKHKRQKAEYAHPLLEPILKPTNGVILYQEQVMQIAREMALIPWVARICFAGHYGEKEGRRNGKGRVINFYRVQCRIKLKKRFLAMSLI
jgi:hypothetical protein